MIHQSDIDNWFTYHAPTQEQNDKYICIRDEIKTVAEMLNELLPDCPDKTATFRKLREVMMSANQTIACNPPNKENE